MFNKFKKEEISKTDCTTIPFILIFLKIMPIQLNLSTLLLGMIISQGFFAAVILWFSNSNKNSNRFLSLLLISISLWLADSFMRLAGIYNENPNWYFMPIFYSFGFGPLIYFYVKSLISHPFEFKKLDYLHFIPVCIQAALYFYLRFQPYEFKKWFWENVHYTITYRIEFDGTWISLLIYLLLSIKLIIRYQHWLVNNYSEVSKFKLNWLKIILGILLLLSLQWLVEIILRDYFNLFFNYDYSIQLLGIIALVLGIGGIRQANLTVVGFQKTTQDTEQKNIDFVIDDGILKLISEWMDKEKSFLNPTLTLSDFSKELKLNPKIVSKHINIGLKKSFNDFVNEYRVAEVKRKMKSTDIEKFTLLAIAYESGFNSKTTFNRIFKDLTGSTPSEYLG